MSLAPLRTLLTSFVVQHCLYTNATDDGNMDEEKKAGEGSRDKEATGASTALTVGGSPGAAAASEQEVWPLCRTEDERTAAYGLLQAVIFASTGVPLGSRMGATIASL